MNLERSRISGKIVARVLAPALIGFAVLDIFGKRLFSTDFVVGAEYGILFVTTLVLVNLWLSRRK